MGPNARKPVFSGLQTTQAQTSPCRLIRAFVIGFMESIICKLVTLAEETGLKLALSETRRQVFSGRGQYSLVLNVSGSRP